MGHDRLAEVNGAVDNALLLLTLQDPRDDGLGGDTVAPVVHHHGAQSVQTLHVHRAVCPHAVQVVGGGGMGGRVSAQLAVVVAHVEAQAEEDVVPDEHLHARLLARVDGHHVAIDYRHGAPGGGRGKVTVDLRERDMEDKLSWATRF